MGKKKVKGNGFGKLTRILIILLFLLPIGTFNGLYGKGKDKKPKQEQVKGVVKIEMDKDNICF